MSTPCSQRRKTRWRPLEANDFDVVSDGLCMVSTGGTFAGRTLFSNDERSVIHVQRPVILSGIEEFVRRGDLSDRTVYLNLTASSSRWPKSPWLLSNELRRIAPQLRMHGISVTYERTREKRLLTLTCTISDEEVRHT